MDKSIEKRLLVLERLLADESGVHPVGCNCAIKSRAVEHHMRECPYRQLVELLPMLRYRMGL